MTKERALELTEALTDDIKGDNVIFKVRFGSLVPEYENFKSIEEIQAYLKRNIEWGNTSKKITSITKIIEEDVNLPNFVKNYNEWLDTKPEWIPF